MSNSPSTDFQPDHKHSTLSTESANLTSPASPCTTASQETLPSLDKELSPNMRALKDFRKAIENQEIAPLVQVLSDAFEWHDLSPAVAGRDGGVHDREAYLRTLVKGWEHQAYMRTVVVHQQIETEHSIVLDITREMLMKMSPRKIQFRVLQIFDFDTSSPIAPKDPDAPSAALPIVKIRRLKTMCDSAQMLRNILTLGTDREALNNPHLLNSPLWGSFKKNLVKTAAQALGFPESKYDGIGYKRLPCLCNDKGSDSGPAATSERTQGGESRKGKLMHALRNLLRSRQ